jgi:cell division protein FtsI (penicillin-binding protein 3)
MEGALRLLDVPPDNVGRWYVGGPLQGAGGLVGSNPPADAPIDDAPIDEGAP